MDQETKRLRAGVAALEEAQRWLREAGTEPAAVLAKQLDSRIAQVVAVGKAVAA